MSPHEIDEPWIRRRTRIPPPQPLIDEQGQFDKASLAAWFANTACMKFAMNGNDFSHLGLKSGDFLITDPTMDFVEGGLVVVSWDLMGAQVGVVHLASDGRPHTRIDGREVDLDEREIMTLMLCGFVAMDPYIHADLSDVNIDRAQLLQGLSYPAPAASPRI